MRVYNQVYPSTKNSFLVRAQTIFDICDFFSIFLLSFDPKVLTSSGPFYRFASHRGSYMFSPTSRFLALQRPHSVHLNSPPLLLAYSLNLFSQLFSFYFQVFCCHHSFSLFTISLASVQFLIAPSTLIPHSFQFSCLFHSLFSSSLFSMHTSSSHHPTPISVPLVSDTKLPQTSSGSVHNGHKSCHMILLSPS